MSPFEERPGADAAAPGARTASSREALNRPMRHLDSLGDGLALPGFGRQPIVDDQGSGSLALRSCRAEPIVGVEGDGSVSKRVRAPENLYLE